MGIDKYKRDVELLLRKSAVVDYDSIARIINNKNGKKQYVKRMINYLLKKGLLKRIVKGHYSLQDDPSLAVFCFQPAYFGLQDALSFHNLWEQEAIPIIITSRNVRQGIRKVFGLNVMIKKIDKKYLFGITYSQMGDLAMPYSDIEKTFIDMVIFNEYLDEEVLKEFKKRIDRKKFEGYLKRYPKNIRNIIEKKIGFFKGDGKK